MPSDISVLFLVSKNRKRRVFYLHEEIQNKRNINEYSESLLWYIHACTNENILFNGRQAQSVSPFLQ